MPNLLPLIGRLRAFEAGHAIPIASHRQIAVQPHALVISSLAMAGEDTTVHAVAIGRAGQPPLVRVVPDPRMRDDHYALFGWLLGIVEPYFASCRTEQDFPQIWVASGAGAGHLDTLADRLRYNRENAPARRLGELLSYATERYPVAGQQALVTATGALRLHFATGQQEGEDEHLGAFLAWIDTPAGRDVFAAAHFAEQQPMGVKTDPNFDRRDLIPLLIRYNNARHRGASPAVVQRHAERIERALSPFVHRVYVATQRAFSITANYAAPDTGMMAELRRLEAYHFTSFMQSRDAGHPLPYRDRPKGAAFRLAAREDAISNIEKGSVHGDAVARSKAFLEGKVLRGRVASVAQRRVPRKTIYTLEVETDQITLHLRERDELSSMDDPRSAFQVLRVDRVDGRKRVIIEMIRGMRAVGCPAEGSLIELGPPPPDWNRLGRERVQMAGRLANVPWTHDLEATPPSGAPRPRPNDLVADVEGLS